MEEEQEQATPVDHQSAGGSRAGASGAAGGASGVAGGHAVAAAPTNVAAVAGASSTQAPRPVRRGWQHMDLSTRKEFMEWIVGLRPGSSIQNVEGYGACCFFALALAIWPGVLGHGETVPVGRRTSSRSPRATASDRCIERFMRDAAVNAALRCHHEETTGVVRYVRVAFRTIALAPPSPPAIISYIISYSQQSPSAIITFLSP
jgi:hypothetical protein